MAHPMESPFREDDLPTRLVALRERRDVLLAELARIRTEVARHRPWSWKRFATGLVLPPVGALLLAIVLARA